MCDFQPKLVAWLDHELPEDQAAEVERHVQACEECRAERENYEHSDIALSRGRSSLRRLPPFPSGFLPRDLFFQRNRLRIKRFTADPRLFQFKSQFQNQPQNGSLRKPQYKSRSRPKRCLLPVRSRKE